MKNTFTILRKALAMTIVFAFAFAGLGFAQGIIPPDDPDDLQRFPHAFNVDTDAVDWEGFTMLPFEGAGLVRIENPDKTGLNTTEFVIEYKKGGAGEGGQPWAGFFYDFGEPISIGENSVFRLKVWSPRSGINALLKFEMRTAADVNTGDIFTPIEAANQWVQLEWDLSEFAPTLGAAPLDRVVIIMDLDGGAGDAGDNFTWYLDDFEFVSDTATSIERTDNEVPSNLSLEQNYPNPFNPTTNITFSMPQSGHATLEVFNMLGQSVEVLVNETLSAGQYTSTFNAANLSSGVYLYRLQVGNEVLTRKLTLVK